MNTNVQISWPGIYFASSLVRCPIEPMCKYSTSFSGEFRESGYVGDDDDFSPCMVFHSSVDIADTS